MNPALLEGVDGVLFDMDGVLLDTEQLYTAATRQLLGARAHLFDWRLKERMMGRAPRESAQILVEALGLPLSADEYNERKRPVLLELFQGCAAKPGAPELVEELAGRQIPMAVATSSDRVYLEAKTKRHVWFSHFVGVVCGSDECVRRHKPAPDIFLEAAKLIDTPPARCLVFEDSAAGVTAARAAGAHRIVAIVDPELDRSLVQAADWIIDDYAQLYR